jgi:hypothetical protein
VAHAAPRHPATRSARAQAPPQHRLCAQTLRGWLEVAPPALLAGPMLKYNIVIIITVTVIVIVIVSNSYSYSNSNSNSDSNSNRNSNSYSYSNSNSINNIVNTPWAWDLWEAMRSIVRRGRPLAASAPCPDARPPARPTPLTPPLPGTSCRATARAAASSGSGAWRRRLGAPRPWAPGQWVAVPAVAHPRPGT